jgi:hypothetical protein
LTTIAGRAQTIENSKDPLKALHTAWKRYMVLSPKDPALKPGYEFMKWDACAKFYVDICNESP